MDNAAIREHLAFAGLLGSTAAEEAVEYYSDLDILLVLDTDRTGNIDLKVIRELQTLAETLQPQYPSIQISLLTHSWNDFQNYVNFEYLKHYSCAEIGFERTKGEFDSRLGKEYERADGKQSDVVIRYCTNQLRMFRFNVLRKCASPIEKKSLTKYLIDSLFEVLDFASIAEDQWVDSKHGLIEQIESLYPKIDSSPARIAYNVRANWLASYARDYEQVIAEVPKLVQDLTEITIQKYPGRTRLK